MRKPAGADRYTIRFSPRKADSFWSPVNTKRARELVAEGRMAAPGRAAFERRDPNQTAKYSYERAAASFSPTEEKLFRANRKAWDFFQAQPPYYRRTCTWFVASAKRDETRLKRLERLIATCAAGRRLI